MVNGRFSYDARVVLSVKTDTQTFSIGRLPIGGMKPCGVSVTALFSPFLTVMLNEAFSPGSRSSRQFSSSIYKGVKLVVLGPGGVLVAAGVGDEPDALVGPP